VAPVTEDSCVVCRKERRRGRPSVLGCGELSRRRWRDFFTTFFLLFYADWFYL